METAIAWSTEARMWSLMILLLQGQLPVAVDSLRYWLELAYFASGVLIACFAGFGVWQIFLAKKNLELASEALRTAKSDIQIRAMREAIITAAAQCERYAAQILPNYQAARGVAKNASAETFRWGFATLDLRKIH